MPVESLNKNLSELLIMVGEGKIQLPEFQRSWVWDNTQICKLIESITSDFPMGAAMFLETGGNSIKFKYRKFTAVESSTDIFPEYLVLDGQQRLTTLFQVFKSKNAVITKETNKVETVKRYYYIDIKKAIDIEADRMDAIIAIPENKKMTENIGRDVKLDLSTREKEYENLMFPLNIAFSLSETIDWMAGLDTYYKSKTPEIEILQLYKEFYDKIVKHIDSYQIPVIYLKKNTPKEAVCQIFENVNTGGISLTVFELVTATFAADDFDLRNDWNEIQKEFSNRKKDDLLKDIAGTNFLTAMTLLVSYKYFKKGNASVSCKKRDILKLELSDYRENRNWLVKGFEKSADFLAHQGIFSSKDLPYSSQLIPLAAVFAFAEECNIDFGILNNKELLSQWYWCGVFGEQYGGANETRFALDMVDIFNWISDGLQPDTVKRANFQAPRLLTMQTRNSAAYKGVMALIMQDNPLDFMSANRMDIATYLDENTDIHHIFPQAYCENKGYLNNKINNKKWNSVVNKTLLYASTNRSIGGRAPSEYIKTMLNKGLSLDQVKKAIVSHKIDFDLLRSDDFEKFIVDRAIRLLDRIEKAMGKAISGRDSEDTIRQFGAALSKTQSSQLI